MRLSSHVHREGRGGVFRRGGAGHAPGGGRRGEAGQQRAGEGVHLLHGLGPGAYERPGLCEGRPGYGEAAGEGYIARGLPGGEGRGERAERADGDYFERRGRGGAYSGAQGVEGGVREAREEPVRVEGVLHRDAA